MAEAKLGRKLDEEVKNKISRTMKGKSNFHGKRHSEESKQAIGAKQIGNSNVKDRYWAHDPRSDSEIRVKSRLNIPVGYSQGRDYYSIEPLISYAKSRRSRSRNS